MGIFGNPSDDKTKQGYVNAANKPASAQKPAEALKASKGDNMQAVRNAAFEAERQERAFGKKK
jgi:hypothetical protein